MTVMAVVPESADSLPRDLMIVWLALRKASSTSHLFFVLLAVPYNKVHVLYIIACLRCRGMVAVAVSHQRLFEEHMLSDSTQSS